MRIIRVFSEDKYKKDTIKNGYDCEETGDWWKGLNGKKVERIDFTLFRIDDMLIHKDWTKLKIERRRIKWN